MRNHVVARRVKLHLSDLNLKPNEFVRCIFKTFARIEFGIKSYVTNPRGGGFSEKITKNEYRHILKNTPFYIRKWNRIL